MPFVCGVIYMCNHLMPMLSFTAIQYSNKFLKEERAKFQGNRKEVNISTMAVLE